MVGNLNRRALLSTAALGAVGASVLSAAQLDALANESYQSCGELQDRQARQKQVELFFRSYYAAKDDVGVPRFAAPCTLPPTKNPASDGLLEFVSEFQGALARGDYVRVTNMMTDDCVFIHPFVYKNPPGYRTFNADTTLLGKAAITSFLRAGLQLLPDGENSKVTRVIGSLIGGGYQSQSGGLYATQGLTRQAIFIATALDFTEDGKRISRMSVKFDTFQMTPSQRLKVQKALVGVC